MKLQATTPESGQTPGEVMQSEEEVQETQKDGQLQGNEEAPGELLEEKWISIFKQNEGRTHKFREMLNRVSAQFAGDEWELQVKQRRAVLQEQQVILQSRFMEEMQMAVTAGDSEEMRRVREWVMWEWTNLADEFEEFGITANARQQQLQKSAICVEVALETREREMQEIMQKVWAADKREREIATNVMAMLRAEARQRGEPDELAWFVAAAASPPAQYVAIV